MTVASKSPTSTGPALILRYLSTLSFFFLPMYLVGCTSFVSARSAEVVSGPAGTATASIASPPGDAAAWFWAFSCARGCNRTIPGYALEYTHGIVPDADGVRAYEVGAGVSGVFYPYLHGYMQMSGGDSPLGVGARIGVPIFSWHEHQLYVRYDAPLNEGRRLLFNPAVFLHTGSAPNGAHPGTFVALAPSVGLLVPGDHVSFTPSASFVLGSTHRSTSSLTAFGTISVSVTCHGERR